MGLLFLYKNYWYVCVTKEQEEQEAWWKKRIKQSK